MGILYVAGEQQGVGATAVATALASLWKRAGRSVIAIKAATWDPEDADQRFYAREFGGPDDNPVLLTRESDLATETIQAITERLVPLSDKADVVVVEGLPLIAPDGEACLSTSTLVERIGARVLGVVPYRRDLDSAYATRWRNAFPGALMGVVVNRRTRYAGSDSEPKLSSAFHDVGVPLLGTLTDERRLVAPTVQQVIDLLDGTVYSGSPGDQGLIEHFLIGGLITEWGGNYFGRLENQAVFVRGGRTDIQMSALDFPLKGLFLTGCQQPPQYVYQRATDLDVPLVTVAHDTPSATAMLESLEAHVTVDHPDKIDLLVDLASEKMDIATIGASVGLRGA